MSFDGRELRNALGRFATGVCLITTVTEDGEPLALTANSFSSVSLAPPLVLWNLQNNSDVYAHFATPNYFAINVLSLEQQALSNQYAKKGEHTLAPDHFSPGKFGAPCAIGLTARGLRGSRANVIGCRATARYVTIVLPGRQLCFTIKAKLAAVAPATLPTATPALSLVSSTPLIFSSRSTLVEHSC